MNWGGSDLVFLLGLVRPDLAPFPLSLLLRCAIAIIGTPLLDATPPKYVLKEKDVKLWVHL